MKQAFLDKNLGAGKLDIIDTAVSICVEYFRQGYNLTLRQLYYQYVARDIFPDDRRWTWTGFRWIRDLQGTKNADPNYKWLGGIISDARLIGLLDWDYIVDRTRRPFQAQFWDDEVDAVRWLIDRYREDVWADQAYRVEVWVEKEALAGVIDRTADDERCLSFSCRGYVSQSAMWEAAQRHNDIEQEFGQEVIVLHLGDHDPSGIDMTRDIRNRLRQFGSGADVIRIALNMDQIEELNPPPNPAKQTDARAQTYIAEYGYDSWELDALEPTYLDELITDHVGRYRDEAKFEILQDAEDEGKERLLEVARDWDV